MKETKEKERETLRNEQNNPFSGEKNSVFIKKQKTQNTKKGWRPTASKHTCRFFFVVPLVYSWSCIVFVYLVHCKSVTHLVFFDFRCFVFLLFGGCVSFIVSIFVFLVLCVFDFVVYFSAFVFVWPKNQIKSQNIWNVHFDVLFWCLHPRIFTWPS